MPRRRSTIEQAVPNGILTPDEMKVHVQKFLDLFEEQLRVLPAKDPNRPTVVECFAARRMAAVLWMWDRTTNDVARARRLENSASPELVWQELFRGSEVRSRLNELTKLEICDAQEMARIAARSVEVLLREVDTNREEVA